MNAVPVQHYLVVGALLFSIGLAVAVTKRNVIGILLGLELMLNAVNVNLVAFSRHDPELLQGQLFALFVMVVAAAEICISLAIVLRIYAHFRTVEPDALDELRG